MKYSNPWKRLISYFVDSILVMIPPQLLSVATVPFFFSANNEIIAQIAHYARINEDIPPELFLSLFYGPIPFIALWALLYLVTFWLYFALMESSSKQATLGKMIFSMIVTDEEGKKISFGTASLRILVKYLCATIFLLFLPIFFSKKKQTLHDLAAGTVVIDKE